MVDLPRFAPVGLYTTTTDPAGIVMGDIYVDTRSVYALRWSDGVRMNDPAVTGGFYAINTTEVLYVPTGRMCITHVHSSTDGRLIIDGRVASA